ncbi:MAG: aminoglycoside phosphotransferase family protein [Verrucomicrobia bacterium]|nr:aminoglycoside phosphotransferase family protein [Verrucomicrobiota bacterium]
MNRKKIVAHAWLSHRQQNISMSAALDIEEKNQLVAYLRRTGRIGYEESVEVTVLPGGVSNRTVLVQRGAKPAWVLKQALPKLRVQVDWFSPPERSHREATGLRWLAELAPEGSITSLIFEDRAAYLLAMLAVPQPHENWKAMLLAGRLNRNHVEQFARLLAAIHRNAWLRRDKLAKVFNDRSFFTSLRLEPYYAYAATQAERAQSFLRALIEHTRARRHTLVHGDYSPKNILVHEDRLVLLDHEVVHWGDPAFDLGFSLTHFLSKAHHLPAHRSAFAEAAQFYWQEYREALGDVDWGGDLEAHAVRHTLGCLLGRVAGRSPLEYLDDTERARQREAVVKLMQAPPATMTELVNGFLSCLS